VGERVYLHLMMILPAWSGAASRSYSDSGRVGAARRWSKSRARSGAESSPRIVSLGAV
jgi:hypothetical protein